MKIIKPSFEIWDRDEQRGGLAIIERAGRVCYKSEPGSTPESAERFARGLIKRGHNSVLEHGDMIFEVDSGIYDVLRSTLNGLEDSGEPAPMLNMTRIGGRCIVSGNIRAWRELFAIGDPISIAFIGFFDRAYVDGYGFSYESYIGTKAINARQLFYKDLHERNEKLVHLRQTVKFTCDRGVSHEFVRHRTMSFSQESTRYCVAGNMKLTMSNPHITGMTVEELYQNRITSPNGAWKRMRIRQYNEQTGELMFAGVREIVCNGERHCIKIKTKLGYELTCTSDHLVLTPNGYHEAGQIEVGSSVYVNGTDALYTNYDWLFHQSITLNKTFVAIAQEFGLNVSTLKKWARKLGVPKKGTGYFHIGKAPWNKGVSDERQAEALRKYHHCGRRKEGIMKPDTVRYAKHKGDMCSICAKKDDLEVHHIDRNHSNNSPDNLITVCESCHRRIHSQNLLTAYADEVVEIADAGIQTVYDIEMDSEHHNFVANGVIVHNCNYSQDRFGKEITVIEPCYLVKGTNAYNAWSGMCEMAEDAYFAETDIGLLPQEARAVLVNSTKTELVMTGNLRAWQHFFDLRARQITGPAHPQAVELAAPLMEEMVMRFPDLFE